MERHASNDCRKKVKKNKRKKRKKRKKKRKAGQAREAGLETSGLNCLLFNPCGLKNKEPIIKNFMTTHNIGFAAFPESQTYHDTHISDENYVWDPGVENRPSLNHKHAAGGIGALISRDISHSIVASGSHSAWFRIDCRLSEPIFVAACYFPQSSANKEHARAWKELSAGIEDYRALGHIIILGDFNAHTGLDDSKVDTAGRLLTSNVDNLGLQVLNDTDLCNGKYTRTAEQVDGKVSRTTIDYAIVSHSLLPLIEDMTIHEDRLGSDHHPIVIKIRNVAPTPGPGASTRKVWRLDNIPHYKSKDHDAFITSYAAAFERWSRRTKSQIEALQAADADNSTIANIIEHSFQSCLDETTNSLIGTKTVGPPIAPRLSAALNLLNNQRRACDHSLRRVVSNPASTEDERALAVKIYREAKARALRAGAARRELIELAKFRDIETSLPDSKRFWEKAACIMNGVRSSPSPPPVVEVTEDGITRIESDPIETLKIWREFWNTLANPGKEEAVHLHLERLKSHHVDQPDLDAPITREEVWRAVRKIKCGKAPGVDDILSTIIKEACDAVGTSKLHSINHVVDSLTLLFNFVFRHEVWPDRWAQGIIFPLFKNDGSRLNPGNYRPIALLSQISKLFGSIVENRISDWSQTTHALADEQGGFRRHRGTPEMIFMLREIILTRKTLNCPTFVTFVDARKAYDSVWREGNWVRLYDLGIRGKLWRQLQAMCSNTESKIRLPFGETEWFQVTRGVAQGAVESPFLYNCFVNALAEELRDLGLGVQAAGVLTPCLMYADDIALLAPSIDRLRRMNQVTSDFAYRNRYQFNGSKSGVMVFNANDATRAKALAEPWELLGEKVKVTNSYKYLGIDILENLNDWSPYMARTISKARRGSENLAWLCRREAGLLPRSAAFMWKAVVRPVLEYGSELWAGDIGQRWVNKAEKIQVDFARTVLGLQGCQSIPDDFLRCELGLEKISCRWEKLRLGYWRRLHTHQPPTTLQALVSLRRWQVNWAPPNFNNGWMGKMKDLLCNAGLSHHWPNPFLSTDMAKRAWKEVVYDSVEDRETMAVIDRLSSLTSAHAARYARSKHWGKMDKNHACMQGEINRRGMLVPEAYLDDRDEPVGRRLKLMCRAGCLPVLKRAVREANLPEEAAICRMCTSNRIEDMDHFILDCPAYNVPRAKMWQSAPNKLSLLPRPDKIDIILGKSMGPAEQDDRMDMAAKRFLKKAWRTRKNFTKAVNTALGRNDTPWALHARGDGLSRARTAYCSSASRGGTRRFIL